MFKTGDLVVCVDARGSFGWLKQGQVYKVDDVHSGWVWINGDYCFYPSRFKLVEESASLKAGDKVLYTGGYSLEVIKECPIFTVLAVNEEEGTICILEDNAYLWQKASHFKLIESKENSVFKVDENVDVCVTKTTEFFYESVEGFVETVALVEGESEVVLSSTNPDDEEYVIQIDDIPNLVAALQKAYNQSKGMK